MYSANFLGKEKCFHCIQKRAGMIEFCSKTWQFALLEALTLYLLKFIHQLESVRIVVPTTSAPGA